MELFFLFPIALLQSYLPRVFRTTLADGSLLFTSDTLYEHRQKGLKPAVHLICPPKNDLVKQSNSGIYVAFSVMYSCTQHFTRPTQLLHQKFSIREMLSLPFQYSCSTLNLEQKISGKSNELRRPVKDAWGTQSDHIKYVQDLLEWRRQGKTNATHKTFFKEFTKSIMKHYILKNSVTLQPRWSF